MSESLENKWIGLTRNAGGATNNSLNNLTIKQIEFNNQNQQLLLRPKHLKPALPTKIYHHGYYKTQSKNKKMLPGIPIKPSSEGKISGEEINPTFKDKNFGKPIRNNRNSEILNSLIQILKTDPDNDSSLKGRNGRIKTQPSYSNEFIESRQISSVKNSRGPKIINNQIMMLGNQKAYRRNLVSEQKCRPRIFGEETTSVNKRVVKKLDPFDQMQLTFYKPSRTIISEQQNINLKKLEQNQFIMD